MIEVLAGERIITAEKGPAYTAGPAVIDSDFPIVDDFATSATRHGTSFRVESALAQFGEAPVNVIRKPRVEPFELLPKS
jgi:hypothetical protein